MSRLPSVSRVNRTGHVIVTKSDPAASDADLRRLAAMFDGPLDGEDRTIPFHADTLGDWQSPQEPYAPWSPKSLDDLDLMRRNEAL